MTSNFKFVRYGVVSGVAADRVRVAFEDEDGLVSDWLPVIVPNTKGNKDIKPMDVGEDVVCVFLPNGVSSGFCLGAFYRQGNPPPHADVNVRSVRFSDGTIVSYDRETHVLDIKCGTGTVNIVAGGNVNVTGDVIADGISLKQHVHPESIGTQTGPPSGGA
ncbi:MAG: phage baseplate assembly protein V [Sporomusaceae bacterium]|nr:phage baseplate assembly protein V [Sporomusaceae bacterium]